MMPTSQWYGSIAPEVKQGIMAPYDDAANQMLEVMGARGQTGSPGSGYTGAAGAALGELYADAGKDLGLNLWQMSAPAATAGWQANLARNMNQFNLGQQEALADYGTAMNVWNRPMQGLGMLPASMPTGYATGGVAAAEWVVY